MPCRNCRAQWSRFIKLRVLLIKTSSLGDVIHALPALTDAARAIPGIKFDWVVEEGFAEIPMLEAKRAGVKSIFDCTPNFLGRDVALLQMLSKQSGITIVTNTGYYGAVGNKYLPAWAHSESDEQLAARWIKEFQEHGIDNTSVKPGFVKISVDATNGGLTEIHKKLVRAAALTHLKTGLTICSHTGPASAALEEIDILKSNGVQYKCLCLGSCTS